MKRIITLLLIVSILFCNCSSTKKQVPIEESKINRTYKNHRGDQHLVGLTTRAKLTKAPNNNWFSKNYDALELKESSLEGLKSKTKGIAIKLFMGTWCGDSRREVPNFLKVMDYLGVREDKISIINLYDRTPNYKQSPDHEEANLNIHRVPTFIFYKEGKEIGRIVESPLNSMEIDVAQILLNVPSRPKYRAVTALNKILEEKGVASLKSQKELLARQVRYTVKNSSELNTYGYVLLDKNKKEAAVTIFEINALAFPKVPNVFDSLAEGYLVIGNKKEAIINYQKVLELDKGNKQAKKILAELKKERS